MGMSTSVDLAARTYLSRGYTMFGVFTLLTLDFPDASRDELTRRIALVSLCPIADVPLDDAPRVP